MKHVASSLLLLALFSSSIKAQAPDSIPTPVLNFYGSTGLEKVLNEKAPKETLEFGKLAGIWYCTGLAPDFTGKVDKVPYKAFWAWKYILDGYAMQDYFYQGKNEFLYWDFFKRDLILTQIRVYDPGEKIWKIAFVSNSAGEIPGSMSGSFTATKEGDAMVMAFTRSNIMNRIIFSDIKENSFEWRSEQSTDSGKTWTVQLTLSATRVK